jgi:glycosyltransferase involved in cell wall biosynthesis
MAGPHSRNLSTVLVSVVMPTNRRSAFLPAALQSLRAQTLSDWELVLVADGCPDPDYLRDAIDGDARMRLVYQSRTGVAAARNRGVRLSRGEIIAFLDDDDLWDPEHLAVNVASLLADPCAVAASSGCDRIGADGVVSDDPVKAPPTPQSVLSGATCPSLQTLTVRRDAFSRLGGFDPDFTLASDLDFMLRLVMFGPLAWTPRVTAHYRRHPGNITSDPVRTMGFHDRVISKHLATADRTGDGQVAGWLHQNRSRAHRYYASECLRQARHRLWEGDVRVAFALMAKGMALDPAAPAAVGSSYLLRHTRALAERTVRRAYGDLSTFGARRMPRFLRGPAEQNPS